MLTTQYTPLGQVLQVPIEYDLSGLTVQVINNAFMNRARYLGLRVQVWTVNDPEEMRWLIEEKKVDGIMSDNPETLEGVIDE
ncbi:MAG: glycerophosphodiester phosphodiesterase family protein [Thermodesulfobacteriota bacterium]|nr:glycerophosphodiester phosphodiesterase family protein [Thermodesulfobacteriota bacterium]